MENPPKRKEEKALSINYGKKQSFKVQGKPMKIGDSHASIMSVSFEPCDGKSLAVGAFDGSIKLYSPHTGKQTQVLNPPPQQGVEPVPITSVRFRPNFSG